MFDRRLPGFHFYGPDIALEEERLRRTGYNLDMPLTRNAEAQLRLGPDYLASCCYMVRRWRDPLHVPTTCGVITANPFVFPYRHFKPRGTALFWRSTNRRRRLTDPGAKAFERGISQLLTSPLEHER